MGYRRFSRVVGDQGADDRGSRPIGNAPDSLYVVEGGAWYGWPDFVCGRPVTDPAHRRFVCANGYLLAVSIDFNQAKWPWLAKRVN